MEEFKHVSHIMGPLELTMYMQILNSYRVTIWHNNYSKSQTSDLASCQQAVMHNFKINFLLHVILGLLEADLCSLIVQKKKKLLDQNS